MRKFRAFVAILTLSLVTSLASASGSAELVVMPVEQAAKHLAKLYKIADEEALMLANTIIKGTELSLGRSIPANQAELTKLLSQSGNERLKRAFDAINVEKLDSVSDSDLGKFANEIGAIVDSSRSAADVCRTCGITETLYHRFGLRIYIPLEVETSMKILANTPNDLRVILRDIEQFNKRGTIKNASSSKLNKYLTDKDDAFRLTKHDLRKAHFALKSLDGSNGPEAKSAAEALIASADGEIFQQNRLAMTIADFVDEGVEGKATLLEISEAVRKVNVEHKSTKARRSALCQHFAGMARGSPAREASFRKLQRCPNYQLVFTACAL